jgi:signal transduction histidine kinase
VKRLTTQWAEPEHRWNFTKDEPGLGLTMLHEMLVLMNSGLQIISEYGNGSEFYFELDQKIVDSTPIGPMELS